jgi:hypothetical protein
LGVFAHGGPQGSHLGIFLGPEKKTLAADNRRQKSTFPRFDLALF